MSIPEKSVLMTGGSGLLGKAVRGVLPNALFPSSGEFDVCDYGRMSEWAAGRDIRAVLHAAAFISPPKVDQEPLKALAVNIQGAANLVRLCAERGWRLVYISTDYVFDGKKGNYREDDPVYPVNRYAWSKLGGECAVRMYDDSLIVRTSFGPEPFPFPKAFVDQWTTRLGVSAFAAIVAGLAVMDSLRGTIHVGGARRTIYEYALTVAAPGQEIGELSLKDVTFAAPVDTSLDCSRLHTVLGK